MPSTVASPPSPACVASPRAPGHRCGRSPRAPCERPRTPACSSQRARTEAGVEVEVVSGVEEARLIHLGVLQAVPVFDQRLLLCDIGGGSTEVLLGQRGEMLDARSFKLGAVRLTDRFFSGPTTSRRRPASPPAGRSSARRSPSSSGRSPSAASRSRSGHRARSRPSPGSPTRSTGATSSAPTTATCSPATSWGRSSTRCWPPRASPRGASCPGPKQIEPTSSSPAPWCWKASSTPSPSIR